MIERRRISSAPSTNGGNGRGPDGRFKKGNAGGPGNPLVRRVQVIRSVLVNAITPEAIQAVVQTLISKAKDGDVAAAKIIFERGAGPAQALDIELHLTELENQLLSISGSPSPIRGGGAGQG